MKPVFGLADGNNFYVSCERVFNELRVCAARSRRGSSVERTRGCWHPHRAHKSLWKFHLMAAAKACWRSVASRRWKLGHALNARSAGASALPPA